MMRLRSLRYYIGEALRNLFVNRLMAFASSLTVVACIFIFCVSLSLLMNLDHMLKQLESSADFNVTIKNDATQQQIDQLRARLLSIEHVKDAKFVNYDDALNRFSDSIGNTAVLDGLQGTDILPRSFIVETDGTKNENRVAAAVMAIKGLGIDEVVYDADIVNRIVSIDNAVRLLSVLIILILLLQAVIVIMNTIKLTVNNRRTEIRIMKYIGATDWFIRWPFVLEGFLIGLIGAVFAVLVAMLFYDNIVGVLTGHTFKLLGFLQFLSAGEVFNVLAPAAVILGGIVGIVGSLSSVRRYLKA